MMINKMFVGSWSGTITEKRLHKGSLMSMPKTDNRRLATVVSRTWLTIIIKINHPKLVDHGCGQDITGG